jgi:hypothetical protein
MYSLDSRHYRHLEHHNRGRHLFILLIDLMDLRYNYHIMQQRYGETQMAKHFHYHFREMQDGTVHVTKWTEDGDGPLLTYHLSMVNGRLMCDCPASFRFADRPDKHVGWYERYRALRQKKTVPNTQGVYYASRTDRFYPWGADMVTELTEKGEL